MSEIIGNGIFVGGSGSSGGILCLPVEYYGRSYMEPTGSISGTINNLSGLVAILAICHRDDITVSGWTLVANNSNPRVSTRQEVSIYKKVIQSNSENFAISQASSVRMSAALFVFSKDPNIEYYETKSLDPNSATYKYTFEPLQNSQMSFVVISNIVSGNGVTHLTPEKNLFASNQIDNINNGNTASWRFLPFINISPFNTEYNDGTFYSEDGASINRAFVYKINIWLNMWSVYRWTQYHFGG